MDNSSNKMYLFSEKIDIEFAYSFIRSFVYKVEKLPIKKKLHLYIAGNGGEVGPTLTIVNQMLPYRDRLITHCAGYIASASLYPYLLGVERWATDLSMCLTHPINLELELGTPNEAQQRVNMLAKINLLDQKLIFNLAPTFWDWYNAHKDGEYILIGKEMKEHGLATHYQPNLGVEN